MKQHPDHKSIRRIVLPSGRSIEVVRFFLEDSESGSLHICLECGSRLVQPVQWSEAPQGFWELTLRCPNCDWLVDGVFDQNQVDALEQQLDAGLAEMLSDLRRLTQANMAGDIERFAAALDQGYILPEDF